MARLEIYLTQPLAEAVGWALLHSLWQGALVALLFAVGLALLRGRDPRLRYLLGCAALVLLIALPAVTGVTLYNSGTQTRAALPDLGSTVSTASAEHTAPRQGAVAAPAILTTPLASSLPEHFTARFMGTLQTSAPWLAAVWLVGVVLLLLRLLGQALYVHRFRARHQIPADVVWQERARVLASRLGVRHAWRLVQSDRTESPLTFGVLRPLIVLPTSAITGMPAVQLEAVLAHEFAHIKRHDYLVNLVQCVIETLLFYHPAVWWVSSEVRRAREECCDDVAVSLCGDAKLYARALTNLEILRQNRPALVLAATDMPLLARVRRLLGLGEVRYTPPLATGALLFLTVAATIVLSFIPFPVAAQNTDEPSAQPGSLWISVSPGVTFDNAYTRISKLITPKTYVLVEERTAAEQRAVRVTRGASNTDFVYAYTVDRAARPFDAQAQAWFDAALKEGALEPLKEYAANQARSAEGRRAQLSSRLSYDEGSNRYISFLLAGDAHLEPSSMATIETSLGKRNLLSQVAHYAAHNLVADSETGDYLKLFINRSGAPQLEPLTLDVMSIVAELEDEAVKTDVMRALETRLRNTVEQQGLVAGQISTAPPTASPTTPAATQRGSSINGVVVWNSKRLTNIKVELQEESAPGLWYIPRVLQVARTDAQGRFRFENVSPGDYMVWALGNDEGYLNVGMSVAAYEETSGVDVLRLDKPIEVISPRGTTGVSLTPTLRWRPVPSAVRYEVALNDLTSAEDPITTPLYYRTDKPNLKIAEPLKRNRFYSWSVTAYTEDDAQIAIDYEGPVFSTGHVKTLRPVKLRSIGASTVLPADWQQTSPGVFRYVNTKGESGSLTFERQPRTDLEAGLSSDALNELKWFPQRHAGRDWGVVPLKNGSLQLVTMEGDSAYLITAKGLEFGKPTRLTVELLGIVVPTMLRNFEISG